MVKKNTHWLYGIITGIITTGVIIIFSITKFDEKPHSTRLTAIPFLIGIILNSIAFSKANKANVTFSDVFRSCFKATCIVSCIVIVWYGFYFFSHPEMTQQAIEAAKVELEKKHIAQDRIDEGVRMQQKMLKYEVTLSMAITYIIYGTVFSIIGAWVAKKRTALPAKSI